MLSTASTSRRRFPGRALWGLWFVLVAIFAGVAPAAAAEPPPVMIIFDGSGSMWAKLRGERQPKVLISRAAIAKVVPNLPPQTRIGLTSFGHRRQGSCTDVEVLRAPTAGDPDALTGALDALNPKGRGPVTAALREAVQALPGGDAPSAIVLVHDDVDNCQQNPCSLVDEVRKTHPRLVVHVVSIDLKPEENTAMLCLPRATGGRHFPVRTSEEIESAIETALRSAAGPVAASAAPPAPAPAVRPAASPKTPIATGLNLEANLPITNWARAVPVRWRITAADKGGVPSPTFAEGPRARLVLADGRYVVELRTGLVTARQEIDVKSGEGIRVAMPTEAGAIELAMPAGRNWTALSEALLSIRAIVADGSGGAARQVHLGRGADRVVPVPAGRYLVSIQRGVYREEREVTVTAGTLARVELTAALGEIELIAVASDGGRSVEDAIYIITEDDPQATQGRREVTRSGAARPIFALPAGTYQVLVRHGEAEVRERIAVRPGETLRRVILLGTGQLKLAASGLPPGGDDRMVRWDIVPVGGDGAVRPIVLQGVLPIAEVALLAGRYRVSARFGRQNANAMREVVVRPGGSETITLGPAAAHVRLLASDGRGQREAGASVGEVYWTIRTAAGDVVWRTSASEPAIWLQEGTYIARAEIRGRSAEAQFAVRAGGDGTVTVAVP